MKIVIPNDEERLKIARKIAQKSWEELCTHEIRWLIVNVLFTEVFNGALFCKHAISFRLIEFYKYFNPSKLPKNISEEELARTITRQRFSNYPASLGFVKIQNKRFNDLIKVVLLYNKDCIPAGYKGKSFQIYIYSHYRAVWGLERMEKERRCTREDCVICGGKGKPITIAYHFALFGLFFERYGAEALKLAKIFKDKLWQAYPDLETFTTEIAKKKHLSSIKDELDLDIIMEQLKEMAGLD